MAKQEDLNEVWVENLFIHKKNEIFHIMQEMVEKKKSVIELLLKIRKAEEQEVKLKEYVKFSENLSRRSEQLEKLVPNLPCEIKEVKQLITHVKKDIAVLESEVQVEKKPTESNKKLVCSMKKMLLELYNNSFDSITQKENKLLELKKKTEEFDDSYNTSKEKKELDDYVKEYDFLKAQNMRLKEMISMNIEQEI